MEKMVVGSCMGQPEGVINHCMEQPEGVINHCMEQPEGVINHCMEQPEVGSRRLHRTARIYVGSVL